MTRYPSSAESLASSASGVQPRFVPVEPGLATETFTSAQAADPQALKHLVAGATAPLRPDWDAWAQILALGAPLAGRTPFQGIHRLQPAETAEFDGDSWRLSQQPWPWEVVEPQPDLNPEDITADILDALRSSIKGISGPLNPMLSGGRDSRLLTALAAQQSGHQQSSPLTAWTTSSDTGTSMEELIAAQVAQALQVQQRIVPAHHDRFAEDVLGYARAVDFMASFHIWLMPVAQQLREHHRQHGAGTILDGLGGGVFLGGGFPDHPELSEGSPSSQQVVDSRFTRMAKYLDVADQILAPGLGEELKERTRADFEPIAHRFAYHPNGATLTAYLTRTLPGISMAPTRVLGGAQPTVMPIMENTVIGLALQVPNAKKYDGVWYPHLLAQADHRLAELPTAAELTGRRQHVRRGASQAAAHWYQQLLLNSPVGELLSERMRGATVSEWSEQLAKTKPQHLIRGLAMLALWLKEYESQLGTVELPFGRSARG